MGLFVAMAAVRDVAVRDVATGVESSNRIDVMEPVGGWTVVSLPGHFIPYEEIATHLSAELGAVVSDLEPLSVVAPRWEGDPQALGDDLAGVLHRVMRR